MACFTPDVFFLTYLGQELRRRAGRTVLTALGLGLGVALVVAVSALGAGLDRAQREVLGPLAGVATDLTVTRPALSPSTGQRDPGQLADLVAENATLGTNLAALGKPGTKFKRDLFAATEITFPDTDAGTVSRLPGVAAVARALTLNVTHQEGTVPEVTAQFQTGGNTVTQSVAPMTDAERAAFRACVAKLAAQPEAPPPTPGPQATPGERSGPGEGGRFGAFESCLPARFRGTFRFVIPRQTFTQNLGAPTTDIQTTSFVVTGIESSAPVNVITPGEVTSGRFLRSSGEALVSGTYAQQHHLATGSTVTLGSKSFRVVGLVKAPLSGQTSDIYVPLSDLQAISGRTGRSNVVLVRTTSASKVPSVSKAIERALPGAQVTDAADLAKQVNGSLVDSANVAHRMGLVLSIVALVAAFALASLLTLSGVGKRVRELGTLKAIGWRPALVVRQLVGESAVIGLLGGVLGAGLGLGGAALLGAFGLRLSAQAAAPAPGPVFGFGGFARRFAAPEAASTTVSLHAPVHPWMIALAAGLALVGGLVAGAAGALRASRLRPADALRDVG